MEMIVSIIHFGQVGRLANYWRDGSLALLQLVFYYIMRGKEERRRSQVGKMIVLLGQMEMIVSMIQVGQVGRLAAQQRICLSYERVDRLARVGKLVDLLYSLFFLLYLVALVPLIMGYQGSHWEERVDGVGRLHNTSWQVGRLATIWRVDRLAGMSTTYLFLSFIS